MADEDYRWLDREAAERLLSGDPFDGTDGTDGTDGVDGTDGIDSTDPQAREQAAQLAKALAALAADDRAGSVVPADISSELPGEAAALAAFREARGPHARTASTRVGAGETVHIGRSSESPRPARWARPLRYGLAAVLAGCMIGGVAVAAGTGVLPSPFGDRDKPGPAASASSVASPEPLSSPSDDASSAPDVEPDDVTTTPEDPTREPGSSAPPQEVEDPKSTSKGGNGGAGTTQPGSGDPQREDEASDWYRKVVSACRDYRSGELQGDKRRRLEEAAKGPRRVTEFCGRVLDGSGNDREHNGGSGDGGNGGDDGDNGGDGDQGNGDGTSGGGNDHWGNGGSSPVPPIVAPSVPHPAPTVTASYSAQPVLPDNGS
ncbi:hypothetical protein GCM10009837_26060 [Streptomyces durmitorensis]|uniref:Uncharacterized protein n=1 Tax=Streptomyces durmitorensis TaxID=319947 RepID=A0ABY4PSB0_9ACTN|nr:hypothetical protein [Streptomyces durmitorensis]UQT56732.1 hypothetical protein M4V62_17405 [Streptomyces durmitorensis]